MSKKKDLNNYNMLFSASKEIQTLKGVSYMLQWDQDTYMPFNAIDIRARQIALLDTIIHEKQTNEFYTTILKKMVNLKTGRVLATTLSAEKKSALKEWHRTYVKSTFLPKDFIEKFSILTSAGRHAWVVARQENNFLEFKPYLERIVAMCREKAELLKYQDHPYDALLDEYEPRWTTNEAEQLFSGLKEPLVNLLKLIAAKPKPNDGYLFGSFAKDKQLSFSKLLLEKMGFDLSCGRLDLSAHPSTIGLHPTDVRLTTAIHPSSLMSNIYSTIHEVGHGLYELGLPKDLYGSPLCETISLGVHESQSRLWEAQLGHGLPFWQYFFPELKKEFPSVLETISLEQFYTAINKVIPGAIRTEADEISYNLHIILRFEIEKSLIEGTLAINDIPEAWNSKMQQYLNVKVKNNAEGCLQDIHWSMGAFGYFPTYTLGNLYAAQLFATIKKQYPNWKNKVAQGSFMFIKEWLNTNIFRYGKRYSSQELVKKATDNQLAVSCFIKYLYDKYKKIYKLELV